VTTDLDLGVVRWWDRGPARDILYASACLPGLFPAITDFRRTVRLISESREIARAFLARSAATASA